LRAAIAGGSIRWFTTAGSQVAASVRQTVLMFFRATRSLVPPVAKAIWRPVVHGLRHIPREGGLILASNHLSFADSVMIPVVVPRKVVFLAKADYFSGTGLRGELRRAWFQGLDMLPVDRDDSVAAMDSLNTALEVLRRGEAFGIYPEGTRSRDGRLYRGRTGVAHLALTARVPVVPVGLIGTDRMQPIGAKMPRIARVEVCFGEPIRVAGEYDNLPTGVARRELTDRIMTAIQNLSGQEAAGRYNERPTEV
jgi:1-acyl-sn-glycerol-3-phosphate acyltransferase